MTKMAIIGAGGAIFLQSIVKDFLLDEVLCKSDLMLMDIDSGRLENGYRMCKLLANKLGHPEFEPRKTTSLQEAVENAKYVIAIFRSGTIEHQETEYEIPAKYAGGIVV